MYTSTCICACNSMLVLATSILKYFVIIYDLVPLSGCRYLGSKNISKCTCKYGNMLNYLELYSSSCDLPHYIVNNLEFGIKVASFDETESFQIKIADESSAESIGNIDSWALCVVCRIYVMLCSYIRIAERKSKSLRFIDFRVNWDNQLGKSSLIVFPLVKLSDNSCFVFVAFKILLEQNKEILLVPGIIYNSGISASNDSNVYFAELCKMEDGKWRLAAGNVYKLPEKWLEITSKEFKVCTIMVDLLGGLRPAVASINSKFCNVCSCQNQNYVDPDSTEEKTASDSWMKKITFNAAFRLCLYFFFIAMLGLIIIFVFLK